MIIELHILLPFLAILLVVAFLYSAVGHGGASGYLALMALFSFEPSIMKPIALSLNLVVAGISFWYFQKNKHFKWKLFYPFAITSIPAAYFGGNLAVDPTLYKQILGVFLFIAVIRILLKKRGDESSTREINIAAAMTLGALIGFFSGMIGIGGGIILSPVILLFNWGSVKETAAVSALFIFVNSAAGLTGHLLNNGDFRTEVFYLIPAAIVGGVLGGLYGSKKFKNYLVQYLLAFVLILAGFKLLLF